jgi:acetyl-CoA decarbonylase/synthase, CODH/ACS complex subunit gamma
MALKGSDIKTMLPEDGKKNCKECGFPTCFSFAMKLAKGEIEIDKCPYIDPGAKAKIEEGLLPPMERVTVGLGGQAFEIGGEEVMYRHEKSFFNEPGIAVLVKDSDPDEVIQQKFDQVRRAVFERAQIELRPNLWGIQYASADRRRFEAVVQRMFEASPWTAVLISEDLDALFQARDVYRDRHPVIYPITAENVDQALLQIKAVPTVVGLKAARVGDLIPLTEKMKSQGLTELLLDSSPRTLLEAIENQTAIRRAALKQENRSLGYPTLAFPSSIFQDEIEEVLMAATFVDKYAGIVVVSNASPAYLYPLLVNRMDIYTDPRKLRTVEGKVYELNKPGGDAPVLVTTNFALTYFLISSVAEASRVPNYLAVLDTGGLGVDTAMGDGRFHGQAIAKFFKEHGLEEKIKSKRLILPYAAARIRNELPDLMPDWEILVGPKSINQITPFLVGKAKEWGLTIGG